MYQNHYYMPSSECHYVMLVASVQYFSIFACHWGTLTRSIWWMDESGVMHDSRSRLLFCSVIPLEYRIHLNIFINSNPNPKACNKKGYWIVQWYIAFVLSYNNVALIKLSIITTKNSCMYSCTNSVTYMYSRHRRMNVHWISNTYMNRCWCKLLDYCCETTDCCRGFFNKM